MDKAYRKSYLLYHLCVFLWGFTAIFGRLISLDAMLLVWYRMGITSLGFLLIPQVWKGLASLQGKMLIRLMCIGVLVTAHWLTFYGSIKEANISVALTCLATSSLFVSLVEPLILRKKFIWHELLLAAAIVPAIYLIFRFSGNYTYGILLGLLSAFFATLFSVYNKKYITQVSPFAMAFTEIATGFVLLSIWLLRSGLQGHDLILIPAFHDMVLLLIFSIVCTVLPFTLSLYCLRHLSVFTASITLNLEPLYGILMAVFFFKEHQMLANGFYAGTLIILLVVFINPWVQKKYGAARKPIAI